MRLGGGSAGLVVDRFRESMDVILKPMDGMLAGDGRLRRHGAAGRRTRVARSQSEGASVMPLRPPATGFISMGHVALRTRLPCWNT